MPAPGRAEKVAKKEFNPVDASGVRIPSSIYFGGCAWGSAFYVGVYKALCEVRCPAVVFSGIPRYDMSCRDGLVFRIRY